MILLAGNLQREKKMFITIQTYWLVMYKSCFNNKKIHAKVFSQCVQADIICLFEITLFFVKRHLFKAAN